MCRFENNVSTDLAEISQIFYSYMHNLTPIMIKNLTMCKVTETHYTVLFWSGEGQKLFKDCVHPDFCPVFQIRFAYKLL